MSVFDELSDLRQPADDQREGRIYEVCVGKVSDVNDPSKLGRVKARYGFQDTNEQSDWLDPMWPGGIESIPHKDDPVLVGFVNGDPHRGWYAYAPTSKTQNRPTDAMVLGTTQQGMINYLVTQFNQLRTDFNSFISTYNSHTHGYNPGPSALVQTAATISSGSNTTAVAAQKGKAADGSVVADLASSEKVLSGRAKVGI